MNDNITSYFEIQVVFNLSDTIKETTIPYVGTKEGLRNAFMDVEKAANKGEGMYFFADTILLDLTSLLCIKIVKQEGQSLPIISKRAPTSDDTNVPLGTRWISEGEEQAYILLKVEGGKATWKEMIKG